jgi:uncharacterized protein (TIGR02284 family)
MTPAATRGINIIMGAFLQPAMPGPIVRREMASLSDTTQGHIDSSSSGRSGDDSSSNRTSAASPSPTGDHMEKSQLIDTLNNLIETSRDGKDGFTACAEDSKDSSLRAYFTVCSTRCREAVHTLEALVKHHGGQPEESGTVMGSVNRAWLNIRAAISSNSDLAVLEECERAEDVAIRAYKQALEHELPADARMIVALQLNGVQENHDRVRAMRDERRRLAA